MFLDETFAQDLAQDERKDKERNANEKKGAQYLILIKTPRQSCGLLK